MKTAAPRYDADAHALYARVGSSRDVRITETRSSDGINFDCNAENIVVGIEVLINTQANLHRRALPPLSVEEGCFDLVLPQDPTIADVQTYDSRQQMLDIGLPDGRGRTFRISAHVTITENVSGTLAVRITGVALRV